MPARYMSPALRDQDAMQLLIAPLAGVEALIYNDLWNAVIERKLSPGTKLEEAVLCEIYGISRTVVRKVLFVMEQEGIVSLPANRGAYIAEPNFQDTVEMLEAIYAAVFFVIKYLASHPDRINRENKVRLRKHLDALQDAEQKQEFPNVRRLHSEFFLLLALIQGNQLLAGVIDRTINRFTIALALFQEVPLTSSRSAFANELSRLILEPDVDLSLKHFESFVESLRKSIKETPAEGNVDLRSILGRRKG